MVPTLKSVSFGVCAQIGVYITQREGGTLLLAPTSWRHALSSSCCWAFPSRLTKRSQAPKRPAKRQPRKRNNGRRATGRRTTTTTTSFAGSGLQNIHLPSTLALSLQFRHQSSTSPWHPQSLSVLLKGRRTEESIQSHNLDDSSQKQTTMLK